jgi:hypothetical protein
VVIEGRKEQVLLLNKIKLKENKMRGGTRRKERGRN